MESTFTFTIHAGFLVWTCVVSLMLIVGGIVAVEALYRFRSKRKSWRINL